MRACGSLSEREVLLSVDNNILEPTPNEANTKRAEITECLLVLAQNSNNTPSLETLISFSTSSKTSSLLSCIAKESPQLKLLFLGGKTQRHEIEIDITV